MNFINWIGKLHRYSMSVSNKFKALGNFFGGIIAVVTAVSYIKKTESFIMDSVHQISDSINETEVYTAGACVALTIGGYTSGFTLGVMGYSLGSMNFLLHPLWKKCLKLEDLIINQENNNFNMKEYLFTIGSLVGGISALTLTTKILNKYNHDYEDPELGPCLSLPPYFIFGATALTIGGYTSGFILEKSCYITNIAWQGINYIVNKYGENVCNLLNRNHLAIDNEDCESLIIPSSSESNNLHDNSIVEGNHQTSFNPEDINIINLYTDSNINSSSSPVLGG